MVAERGAAMLARSGALNCSAACDCALALVSSILASPKMMCVSLAGLLNTSGLEITNRICKGGHSNPQRSCVRGEGLRPWARGL